MKLSLKATYGILASVDLALHRNGDGSPVQAKSIARRQGIPVRFLEQVLTTLKKAGVVDSQRGAQGGYVLSRNPADVSLAEIVEALDGRIWTAAPKPTNGHQGASRGHHDSLLSQVWSRLMQAELEVLTGVTLKELAERQEQLAQEHALMYHI